MPGSSQAVVPTVYAETNWIVSLFYPHRTNHGGAKDLLEAANRGDVVLKIPYGCILEAVHAIESAGQEAMQAIAKATEYITNAQRNGESSLNTIVTPLMGATAFLARNPKTHLDNLATHSAITWLASVTDEVRLLDTVRAKVRFRGKDKFDLYVLATVLADRTSHPNGPSIFCSENKAEFEPRSAGPDFTAAPRQAAPTMQGLPRLPDEIYANAQIVWRSNYRFTDASREWTARFGSSHATP